MNDTHVMVLFRCSDGGFRPAQLDAKQAKRVRGFVAHAQGGTLRLRREVLSPEEVQKIFSQINEEEAAAPVPKPVAGVTIAS